MGCSENQKFNLISLFISFSFADESYKCPPPLGWVELLKIKLGLDFKEVSKILLNGKKRRDFN